MSRRLDRFSFPGVPQKSQRVDHSIAVFAGKTQRLTELGAYHDHDLVKAIPPQLRQVEVPTRLRTKVELNAKLFEQTEIPVEHFSRKPVLRDRTADHAAGIAILLKHINLNPGRGQLGCGCHATRSGADDRDLATCRLSLRVFVR